MIACGAILTWVLNRAWSLVLVAILSGETGFAFALIIVSIIDAFGSLLAWLLGAWSVISLAIFAKKTNFAFAFVTSSRMHAFGAVFARIFDCARSEIF